MTRALGAAPLIALLALLCVAPGAGAAYDPIGSGSVRLRLDDDFVGQLTKAGVTLTAAGPARRQGETMVLPASGGAFDPTLGKGTVETEGALVFGGPGKKIRIRKISIKADRSPLVARVGGGQLKVVTAGSVSVRRAGIGSQVTARSLRLTGKAAQRLNKKLRPRVPLAPDQVIGTLVAKTQPRTLTVLPRGTATIEFDPALVAKLNSRFVSLNPIFPAEHAGPVFTFPIIPDGLLAPDLAEGTLRTGGALEALRLGAGQIFWRELWFQPGQATALAEAELVPSPPYPGKMGQVGVLALGPGQVHLDPRARTIAASGAPLTLTAASAEDFNRAFAEGRPDFGPGELVGRLSFTAQVQ